MKAYVKPSMDAEIFAANEFIAACNYSQYYLRDKDGDGDFSDERAESASYESGSEFDASQATESFAVQLIGGSTRNKNDQSKWTTSMGYVINGEIHINMANNAS